MIRQNCERKKTLPVKVGSLIIGGGHPICVQSMWKAPLTGVTPELIREVEELAAGGCHILRFAVPDLETVPFLGELAEKVSLPLVADIHFSHKIALACLDYPIAKIRINPGNIGGVEKVEEVVKKAGDKGVPIRVGINGGSLPVKFKKESSPALGMVKAAEEELEILEKLSFNQVIFSLKSSDIHETIEANELFSRACSYPLHLGVTEAGPLIPGVVKSTLVFGDLISRGIGDTIRVSLSDTPLKEVIAGHQILKSLEKGSGGINIVSCPTCGRTTFFVRDFLERLEPYLGRIKKDLTVAVMGCPVNGPGEAAHADLGITGAGKNAVIFKQGKIIHRLGADEALEVFVRELEQF